MNHEKIETNVGLLAVLILTGSIIYEQVAAAGATASLTNPTFWVFVFTALGAIILGVWITAIMGQSTRRRPRDVACSVTSSGCGTARRAAPASLAAYVQLARRTAARALASGRLKATDAEPLLDALSPPPR